MYIFIYNIGVGDHFQVLRVSEGTYVPTYYTVPFWESSRLGQKLALFVNTFTIFDIFSRTSLNKAFMLPILICQSLKQTQTASTSRIIGKAHESSLMSGVLSDAVPAVNKCPCCIENFFNYCANCSSVLSS